MLRTVIRHEAEDAADQVRTLLTARVAAFDTVTGLATVDILVRDSEGRPLGRVFKCPVAHLRYGDDWSITAPFEVGDKVWVMCADSSLEEFQRSVGEVTPGDPRRHDLSDAVVITGITVDGARLPIDPDAMVIRGPGDLSIRLTRDGRLALVKGEDEVLDLMHQAFDQLEDATVATLMGPQFLDPVTRALLGLIKGKLAGIKE